MVLGITGGIGSGKSKVLEIFKLMKFKTLSADSIAKDLIQKNQYVISEIKKKFINVIVENKVDKQKLASIVFNNNDSLTWLENLLHPLIYNVMLTEINQTNQLQNIALEIPLLIEKNWFSLVDKTVIITCDLKIRMQRIEKRNIPDKNLVIIKKIQTTDRQKLKYADFIINNNNGLFSLYKKVLAICYSINQKT